MIPFRRLSSAFVLAALMSLSPTAAAEAQQPAAAPAPTPDSPRVRKLKSDALRELDGMDKSIQEMVDMIFSFGELGYQEVETSRYLVALLRRNGFTVTEGTAGMPTAWVATWGSGKPVISLGSDIDAIPQASQKPGVAYRDALVEDAPGHGEGHNSGQAVNIAAALAVKKIMEREKIPGTLVLWPGVAEELVGAKAYFVREGVFKNVDAVLFSHVGNNLGTTWGASGGSGLISLEYTFEGQTAHSAGSPWRGRSALDAVELMNAGWNYRREHLRPQHRLHYVIREGGDQPNVVPRRASVWYYLREIDYPHIQELIEIGNDMAKGAALMTGTTFVGTRTLGTAWPRHFNRPIAEAMTENAKSVGLPKWSAADQALAKALQKELKQKEVGLDTALSKLEAPRPPEEQRGGGSDDIGDVSWVVPTVTLSYPSNIPSLPGHNWPNAIAMATPIAHKGASAGARVQALTMLDLLLKPELIADAWKYFREIQTKDMKYTPLLRPADKPAIELNAAIMAKYRAEMRKFYYDPSKYATYLEQLGIQYPTVRK